MYPQVGALFRMVVVMFLPGVQRDTWQTSCFVPEPIAGSMARQQCMRRCRGRLAADMRGVLVGLVPCRKQLKGAPATAVATAVSRP